MNLTPEAQQAALDAVMAGRHSVRAFLPTTVPRELLAEILSMARRAPSGTNLQPWRVHVLSGAARQRLVEAVCAAYDADEPGHRAEYNYYPAEFFEPYLARRRKIGWGLYGLLGIVKGDAPKMRAQMRRNYEFFGAPVGLIFSIDRRMGQGGWLDYGMFLQGVMLAARARGLDTCPQVAWLDYHRIIAEVLGFGPQEQLVCGMSLGYADAAAVENSLATERAALDEFVAFHD
ncbi:nitroreductase [Sulfuritalea sp.]|uniref:nitroreductase n=1 Tax=Sulfuritalea sp. TaxID=2480090 RepID=UPI00286E3C52|nr:nitroreductase [Sulfuritalea sp.]